jgi:hypothetical protein
MGCWLLSTFRIRLGSSALRGPVLCRRDCWLAHNNIPYITRNIFHNQTLQVAITIPSSVSFLPGAWTHQCFRRNAFNSLAEWASYQRSKMVATDKYDVKWKHLINVLDFAVHPHPPPTRCSRSTCLRTMFSVELGVQSLRKKKKARTCTGGGNTGDNKESSFCWGGQANSKTTICRNYLIYMMQAYLLAFHLKCKMAFNLECINCLSHKECRTPSRLCRLTPFFPWYTCSLVGERCFAVVFL